MNRTLYRWLAGGGLLLVLGAVNVAVWQRGGIHNWLSRA